MEDGYELRRGELERARSRLWRQRVATAVRVSESYRNA